MHIDFPTAIAESESDLLRLERSLVHRRIADRVRLLRYLKTRRAQSLRQYAAEFGYSHFQMKCWWRLYARQGLPALVAVHPPGPRPHLTPEARDAVWLRFSTGDLQSYGEARLYLIEHWSITYQSPSALWRALHR